MVIKPVTSQAAMSSAGELTSRAISADTIKMPEPIMEPITSVVALVRPSPLTNPVSLEARGIVFVSVLNGPLGVRKVSRKNLHQKPQEFLCCAAWGTEK